MRAIVKSAVCLAALAGMVDGAAQAAPAVTVQPWGKTPAGQDVKIITLTNDHAMTVRVITYGGIIQSVEAPDRAGHVQDLVLGFGTLDGYTKDSAEGGLFFGAMIGRYANRLAHGTFTINGKSYHTDLTDPPNALHGGKVGFDKHVWTLVDTKKTAKGASVTLRLVSPNGDQGFPGTLTTDITYTLDENNALSLHYQATTDAPTVLNLTNHSYWNLNGEGSGSIENEILQVSAERYTPTDSTSIPTGELAPVEGTPLDFRKPTRIGDRLRSILLRWSMRVATTITGLSTAPMGRHRAPPSRSTIRLQAVRWMCRPISLGLRSTRRIP